MSCIICLLNLATLLWSAGKASWKKQDLASALKGRKIEISKEAQGRESWPDVQEKPAELSQGQTTKCPGGQSNRSRLKL